ncbi:MAG TPA: hypothetical protein VFL57_19280 [Bryobacteraceae bacterium]|nr:hypothetical protein [Bryobacteraceae bacterium]
MHRYYWIHHDTGHNVTVHTGSAEEPVPTLLQHVTDLSAERANLLRLAGEIATTSPSADVFAILDRRDLRRAGEWARAVHAWPVAPETALVSTTAPESAGHRKGYIEAMLLLALAERAAAVRLVVEHKRANATAIDIAPLLARYGLKDAAAELPADGSFAAELRLSIPGQFLDVWFESPSQRTRKFFAVYSRMSMALQDVLRRWLRYEWLSDLSRFADHMTARALVLYWLSPPRKAASHAEFGYDVMAEETLNRICRRAPRVAAEFKDIASRLERAGLWATAHWYGGPLRHIVGAVHREARSLRRLLAVDSGVLDHLIGFGVAAVRMRQRQREAEPAPPHPIDVAADFAHGLRSHLRRVPLPEWSHDLGTLVMIEATNSMRRSLRLPHGIAVELRASVRGGREVEFRSEALRDNANDDGSTGGISSENLTEADALPS